MVISYTWNCGGASNNEAKALALVWGMRIMRDNGVNRLLIEGDLMLIIKVVKGEG